MAYNLHSINETMSNLFYVSVIASKEASNVKVVESYVSYWG